MLAAESLLARGSSAKPGLVAGRWQHRDVAEAVPQPVTDRVEQLRGGPNLGSAVEPRRELGDDRRDVLGAHVQEDVPRGACRPSVREQRRQLRPEVIEIVNPFG